MGTEEMQAKNATFVGKSGNGMMQGIKAEQIKEAKAKFDSYGSEYVREYFNNDNGGFLVVDKQRIAQGKINKQEQKKYDKEHSMCMTLAQNGNRIEYLKMTDGSFDIYLNEVSADLKKTSTHNNMVHYAKKATCVQGANIVVFEFEKNSKKIQEELDKLKRDGIKVTYYFSNDKRKMYVL